MTPIHWPSVFRAIIYTGVGFSLFLLWLYLISLTV